MCYSLAVAGVDAAAGGQDRDPDTKPGMSCSRNNNHIIITIMIIIIMIIPIN